MAVKRRNGLKQAAVNDHSCDSQHNNKTRTNRMLIFGIHRQIQIPWTKPVGELHATAK